MKEQLLKIAYEYFPRGVDSKSHPDIYYNSLEFNHLSETFIKEFEKQQSGEFNEFYDKLQALNTSMHLHKEGLYVPNERAHNLQLADVKNNILYSICLNISIIAPYYCLYVLETEVNQFLQKPTDFSKIKPPRTFRNKNMEIIYEPLLNEIRQLTEDTFFIKPFPEELLDDIIPDINIDFVRLGNFTMFNAFFLKKYTARI